MAPLPSFTFSDDQPLPPVSFAHLLHSNTPPHAAEASLMCSYVDELESHLASLNKAISPLLLYREELQRTIRGHKATLSRIRRLPPEILGLIFWEVVRAAYFFKNISEVSPATSHGPWLMTRVCRRWSEVALATPSLWSMIFLDLDHKGAVPLLELRVMRSQGVPLTWRIYREGKSEAQDPALDVALSAASRWRIADIRGVTSHALQQMGRAQERFPNLQTLHITGGLDFGDVALEHACKKVFSETPELRHVLAVCWDYFGHYVHPRFTLPWHQLTCLSLISKDNTETLTVLGELSSIIECTLGCTHTLPLSRDRDIIRLLHLRSLTLYIDQGFDEVTDDESEMVPIYTKHSSVLDFLETPCLENLTLHSTADEEVILDFIARSRCIDTLCSFRFLTNFINHDLVLQLVKNLPHLTLLDIGDFAGTLEADDDDDDEGFIPGFVYALSNQWSKIGQELSGGHDPSRPLHVRIADSQLNVQSERKISCKLRCLRAELLLVDVSRSLSPPCIMMSDPE
ncbi:hypothetical protein R3P38DRAFT_2905450 [Favolaschia claudopus]|uniref:F-box domain-containing protein n=1 Tax=Favolaschia claudopus TaxID=2862362 RepID=A0AAW0CGQ3_9AGAR